MRATTWAGELVVFSVMFLLAALLPGCGPGDGVGALKRIEAAERDAILAIEEAGGAVEKQEFGPYTAQAVDLENVAIDDDLLEQLAFLGSIGSITLSGSDITDEQMRRLAKFGSLKSLGTLDISETHVGNEGLLAFADHSILYKVNVTGSHVTPEGLAQFRAAHPENMMGMPLQVVQ